MAKILVADDNSNIQKMVGLALKDQGIDVVAVGNGEAAVRKIADVHPDLVLADVFMPVRNGYEVCRFVKEDPKYSHIPVILLVGAFDPLDEQEAQRVGADGVLKKPFVPPDPLISMVKSALARAGVLASAAAHAEKTTEPAARPAAELLTPVLSAKLAALAPEKIVAAEPEPMEDFPAPPEQVRIAAGHEPVAFGSLLETPEVEDDAAFLPRGRGEIEERSWGVEETEEEEEVAEEEESPRSSWRKEDHETAVDDAEETPSRVPDWRDAAFHGESPAGGLQSSQSTPAVQEPSSSYAEAAHSPAVAVSTLEEKPADAPAPFSGDAWAAAMAAGVEEKLGQSQETAEAAREPERSIEAQASVEEATASTLEAAAVQETHTEEAVKVTESSNGWYSVSSSPWDAEARKASLLAATWDAPAGEPAPADAEHAEPVVEEAAADVAEESHYAGSPTEVHVEHHQTEYTEHQEEYPAEPISEVHDEARAETHEDARVEVVVPGATAYSAESHFAEQHEKTPTPAPETKSWENTWEAGGSLPAEKFAEVAPEEASCLVGEPMAAPQDAPVAAAETAPWVEQVAETYVSSAEPQPSTPDMDTLISRVLEKMNPEVLQKMTHEFLRPVIEAIIKDELNSKKS